jgi:hypothetical protein
MEIERSHFRDFSKNPTHLMPSPTPGTTLVTKTGHSTGSLSSSWRKPNFQARSSDFPPLALAADKELPESVTDRGGSRLAYRPVTKTGPKLEEILHFGHKDKFFTPHSKLLYTISCGCAWRQQQLLVYFGLKGNEAPPKFPFV